MNGMITNWSSPTTSYLGNNTMFLGGMVVIDLKKQTVNPHTKFLLWIELTFHGGNKHIYRHYNKRACSGERWDDICS